MDNHDRRRIQTGGFPGFFGEPDRNPVVEIVDASPAVTAQTCPNMLDEHMQWLPTPAGQPNPAEDGRFLSRPRPAWARVFCIAAGDDGTQLFSRFPDLPTANLQVWKNPIL